MSSADRREIIRFGAAGVLATLGGFAMPITGLAQDRALSAPGGRLQLQRRIIRELVDGAQIVVTRSWAIKFADRASGWAISGQQLAVKVDAPPALEPLAQIERERPTNEIFPIMLNATGLIDRHIAPNSKLDFNRVAVAAAQAVRQSSSRAADHKEVRQFLAQMQQAAGSLITRFPQDLFFPVDRSVTQSRAMDLPGGLQGEMEMTYSAKSCPDSGLLESSERVVSTRIKEDIMRSSENWELQAL